MPRHFLKMSTLGQLVYQVYYRPLGFARSVRRQGGLGPVLLTGWHQRQMMEEATRLDPLPSDPGEPINLHLLTGRRYWYQTAFCAYSLGRAAGRPVRVQLYDDGSLAPAHLEALQRAGLHVDLHDRVAQEARLEQHLPAHRFPTLRNRWQHYPHIRKLIAPHLGSSGWKLVLDSDLLFFRRPDFLLGWLQHPDRPLHAVDVQTAYGYSNPLLRELAHRALPAKVNVGLCGLLSDELDWEQLESWCRVLLEREGTNYLLEQALVALLVTGRDCAVAPEVDYRTCPDDAEGEACRAVMHHYVAGSKSWYFRRNWRKVLPAAPRPGSAR